MNVAPRSSADPFVMGGKPTGFNVGEFWRWFASDLLLNLTRGALAEFVVGQALGCAEAVRNTWSAFDLRTAHNLRIEVKSAAYQQAWVQKKPSLIQFDIAPKRFWNPDTNEIELEIKRQSDVYVFCLLENHERRLSDPLDLSRWKFYVLATRVLNEKCLQQKKIGLPSLIRLKPMTCDFWGLKFAVESVPIPVSESPL